MINGFGDAFIIVIELVYLVIVIGIFLLFYILSRFFKNNIFRLLNKIIGVGIILGGILLGIISFGSFLDIFSLQLSEKGILLLIPLIPIFIIIIGFFQIKRK